MNMTNYMELLMTNQPWNIIGYMVIPVALAEALVATEFFTVYHRNGSPGAWRTWNKWLGIVLGFYFLAVVLKLAVTALPHLHWRGPADVIAVWSYLAGVIPLFSIALLELGLIGRGKSADEKMKLHFTLLILFLIVGHVAMIFGMVDPALMHRAPVSGGHGHSM